MWDAIASRRARRRPGVITGFLTIAGLFGYFGRKAAAPPRVEVRPAAPPVQAPRPVTPRPRTLSEDLPFRGLHGDADPGANVKWGEMTCPSCERRFRYYLNSNGQKTTAFCPGCTRQYRVG